MLFGWLSEVHIRRETHDVDLPNIPALALFFQFSNDSDWNDSCGQEVRALGIASGVHFGDYYRRQLGSSPALPILVDGDSAGDNVDGPGDSAPWFTACTSTDGGSSSHGSNLAYSDGPARDLVLPPPSDAVPLLVAAQESLT